MTPAGLLARGSVLTALLSRAVAAGTPTINTATATAPPKNASLMATNIDRLGAADVANPLLFGNGGKPPSRAEGGAREGSTWPVLAPTVLVLALLLLATAYAGAFNVAQWAPPTMFILVMLLTLVVRGGVQRL